MSVLEETHLLSKDVMKESRPHLLPLPQHIQLVANTCYHLLTEVVKPQLCLCVQRHGFIDCSFIPKLTWERGHMH